LRSNQIGEFSSGLQHCHLSSRTAKRGRCVNGWSTPIAFCPADGSLGEPSGETLQVLSLQCVPSFNSAAMFRIRDP
jgi:hypothetical protein